MLNSIRFGCSALANPNKTRKLRRDGDYYEVVVGALDVFNSAGEYYVYEQARNMFEQSGTLMRRIERGSLRGEYGHPKKEVGQSNEQYAQRVLSLYEPNLSHHFREVWLDFESVKDDKGKPVVAIYAWVTPSGPQGMHLQKQLDNPDENVCFSIRAFTQDYWERGLCKRILRNIVTWDFVNEPGISHAEKFKCPSLESLTEQVFSRGELERAGNMKPSYGMAQESSMLMSPTELFSAFGWKPEGRPAWTNW